MAHTGSSCQRMDYSLVLETANLSFARADALWDCLDSVQCAIGRVGPPREALLYTGGEISPGNLARLRERYPWITVVPAVPGSSYYAMKMAGARQATAGVVVFADSDCRYNVDWLAALLRPFADPDVNVVAGETAIAGSGPYRLALAIALAFDGYTDRQSPYPVNYYYANNVAFRRQFLIDLPIPIDLPVYRSGCFLHCVALRKRGETIWCQPASRADHAPLEGLSHFFWRFLLLGRDRAVRRDLGLLDDAPRVETYDQGRNFFSRRVLRVLRHRPEQRKWLPVALPIAVLARCLVRIGEVAASFKPDAFIGHFSRVEGVDYPSVAQYRATQSQRPLQEPVR